MAFFGEREDDIEVKITTGEEPKGEHDKSSNKKLAPSMTISGLAAEVFTVKFSPDGKYIAAGCGDGIIRVFNASTGVLSQTLIGPAVAGLPMTILRFRPPSADRTKNVLLAGSATGAIQHWHITSGKCLHSMRPDEENQINGIDYTFNGDKFAVSGKQSSIQIYDEDTRKQCLNLSGGLLGRGGAGHSNRVFSVKFHPQQPEMLASGGWDNTVQIWDCRVGRSVRTIYGPHIAGDALDISDRGILTGSWRTEKQLEVWDFGTGKLIETVAWKSSILQQREPCMLYAAQFSAAESPEFIAGGGSGANEARVFDVNAGNALVGTVAGLQRGVFTLDFAPDKRKLAVAGGDATIRVINIVDAKDWDQERPGTASAAA